MAKFCPNCGNEMVDEAAMCVKCGTMVGENNTNKNSNIGNSWNILNIINTIEIIEITVNV